VINGASREYFQYAGMRAANGTLPVTKDEIAVSDDYAKLLNVSPESLVGKNVTLEALVPTEYLDRTSEGYDASVQVGTRNADYKIVGVVPTQKTPTIIMDVSGLKKVSVGSYASSKVKVDDQTNVEGVRKQIENIGYSTEYVGDTISQITQVFSIFRLVLGLFGLVALAVAAIGTFNTLTISLLERIREIGLLKALGMGNRDIYKLFISESLFISLIGGIFGIIIGVGIGQIINGVLGFMAAQAHADTAVIFVTPVVFGVGTAIFSLVVGFLTGWYPARRAVKTDALDALRYE
jgi:ABC-type antimicrobial peptide transport system permease subunit